MLSSWVILVIVLTLTLKNGALEDGHLGLSTVQVLLEDVQAGKKGRKV